MTPPLRLDSRKFRPGPDEILLVACIRNEVVRLPHFLDYYRALGVHRFLTIDNESDDGSTDLLLAQPDVHVFAATGSYAESHYGVAWTNDVLERHAQGHWVLTVDADELLVFPDCEQSTLGVLIAHLERTGADALECFLLDMYSRHPIRDTHYEAGMPFLLACPYFDRDSYRMSTGTQYAGLPVRGGARKRLFWTSPNAPGKGPYLGKTPLVKWVAGVSYKSSTHVIDGLRRGEVTGALLHFKLFSDIVHRAVTEAARGEHWEGASQYRRYAAMLAAHPTLCGFYEGSVKYENSGQLERLGLIRRPPAYP